MGGHQPVEILPYSCQKHQGEIDPTCSKCAEDWENFIKGNRLYVSHGYIKGDC